MLCACQGLHALHAYVPTDDTCFTVRHSSARVENQLRFNSWMQVEHELNAGWTRVERELKLNWDATVKRELICMWNFKQSFNSHIFAYSWSSCNWVSTVNASSFACEIFSSRSTCIQLNWASTVERELICIWIFQLLHSWSSTELQLNLGWTSLVGSSIFFWVTTVNSTFYYGLM